MPFGPPNPWPILGAPDGRAYSAHDPELAKWVFTTLVYTSVGVYEACIAKLTEEEIKALVIEDKWMASVERGVREESDRVARTVADLEGSDAVGSDHVHIAAGLRLEQPALATAA